METRLTPRSTSEKRKPCDQRYDCSDSGVAFEHADWQTHLAEDLLYSNTPVDIAQLNYLATLATADYQAQ